MIKRLEQWQQSGHAFPHTIELNPTSLCNLKCKFCGGYLVGNTDKKSDELTEAECVDIVSEAHELGVECWNIAGDGEPMFRRGLALSIMASIKERGMSGQLITNGTLFTDEGIRTLVDIGWDNIIFSLEGPDPESHDRLCGVKGAFEKIITAFEAFNDYKKLRKKRRPVLHTTTVLTKHNYNSLADIIFLAGQFKIKTAFFEPLITNSNPSIEALNLGEEEIRELDGSVEEAVKASRGVGVKTNVDSLLEKGVVKSRDMKQLLNSHEGIAELDDPPAEDPAGPVRHEAETEIPEETIKEGSGRFIESYCFQPWYKVVIRPDGTVQPCCNFFDHRVENIREKTLREIWSGDYFQGIRHDIMNNIVQGECAKCNVWILKENRTIRSRLMNRTTLAGRTFDSLIHRLKR
ncbi:radical SAM/SPASM domain-containing protein [Thermodesulfobacteriota bacterium]